MTSSRGSPLILLSASLLLALPLDAAIFAARSGRASQGRAVAAAADATSDTDVLVPVLVDRDAQDGSRETTELTITNRTTWDTQVSLVYTASAGGGSGTVGASLKAGHQLVVPDAVAYLRQLGLPIEAGGDHRGTLMVRFRDADGSAPGSVSARTSSGPSGRRSGYAYGGVPRAELADGAALYVGGLVENAADRSSLTLVHAGGAEDGDVTLRVTVLSGDPARPFTLVLPDILLAAGRDIELGELSSDDGQLLANAYVKVERVLGSAPFYAYGLVSDRRSSDSAYVPPARLDTGSQNLTLPAVVGTASYTSDLVATNVADGPRTLRLKFVADGVHAEGRAAEFALQLRPGEQRLVRDCVRFLVAGGTLEDAPASGLAGALFATIEGGGVLLGARTSRLGPEGRFSVFYPAVSDHSAAIDTAWVYGLRQDDTTRSNLAIVNTDAAATDVFRVEVYDGDLGARVATLEGESVAPGGWWQLSSLLRRAPGTKNGYARVTRTAGTGAFFAYAVVNEGARPGEGSGDGAYLPMDPARAALLGVDGDRLDFGKVRVGQTATYSVVVRNSGSAVLHASASIGNDEPFSVMPTTFQLEPGATQGLAVRFQPPIPGLSRSTLRIGGDGGEATVALEGTGDALEQPSMEVSPPRLDFGRVVIGLARELVVTVRNAGTAALVLHDITTEGADFVLLDQHISVSPGRTQEVVVLFRPIAAGPREGVLRITSNDPLVPDVAIPLSGSGAAPSISELFSDDGTVEAGVYAKRLVVVNRFTPALYPTTLRKLKLFVARFPGFPDPSGLQLDVVTFTDPSGSGEPPPDHDNLSHQTVTMPNIPPEGLLWEVDIDGGPTILSGDLYAGFQAPDDKGVVFTCDADGPQAGRSFLSDNDGRNYRAVTVAGPQGPHTPANLILRAVVSNP